MSPARRNFSFECYGSLLPVSVRGAHWCISVGVGCLLSGKRVLARDAGLGCDVRD